MRTAILLDRRDKTRAAPTPIYSSRFCCSSRIEVIGRSWFKHAQLLYGLITLLIKDAGHKSFIAEALKIVNGLLHFVDASPYGGAKLFAVVTKYPPTFLRQLIVAIIVRWNAVGTGVPGITVSFYIDEPLMTKHGKIQEIPFLLDGKFPLAFRSDIQFLAVPAT